MSEPAYINQGATFDPTRKYRYRLWRAWDLNLPRVAFVMLNPSTADETVLDPTLRRCLGYAQAWGCGSFEVVNLFALRSTDPGALLKADDPVGPANDDVIMNTAMYAGIDGQFGIVAGWGAHPSVKLNGRDDEVTYLISRHSAIMRLGMTKNFHPKHPLYLKKDLKPEVYRCKAELSKDF